MEIHEKIKIAREERGLSQAQLAKAVGISQPAIKKIESGETQKSRFLPEVIRFLELDGQGLGRFIPSAGSELGRNNDLRIYAAAEGGPGEMVVSTDPIDIVQRPWYLRNVKDGYGVVIIGESMSPKFEPGDVVIVNPRLPPIRNKPAIFIAGEQTGGFTATIKLLIRETPAEWQVRQFNPRREFVLPKKIWTKALRIVGSYEGS